MTQEIKPKRLLIFLQIVQSWIGNEDKNVDVESIQKQLKINCPICWKNLTIMMYIVCTFNLILNKIIYFHSNCAKHFYMWGHSQ